MSNRKAALIARCSGVDGIVAAVKFACHSIHNG
jgi:hypothetical protein